MLAQGNLSQYCESGSQTKLSPAHIEVITKAIGKYNNGYELIQKIQAWKDSYFDRELKKGELIGTTTPSSIFEVRNRSGCHDDAIVVASMLRHYHIPTIMLESTKIKRAHEYKKTLDSGTSLGEKKPMLGHVFLKVYIDEKRQILDSTTGEIHHYDPDTKIINNKYYIIAEGKDPADYGVNSLDDLREMTYRQLDTIIDNTKEMLAELLIQP